MQLIVHPMVADQKAVLDLPVADRREALHRMLAPPGVDPIDMFALIKPDGDEAEYRAALAKLEAAGAEATCREALAQAREVLGRAVEVRGFGEVRPYIFGDEVMAAFGGAEPIGVPAYAGYAVGYHVVQAHLRKTGKTAAEATLVPSGEILAVADYF